MTHLRAAVLSCLAVDCCNENMFFRGCVFFGVTIRFFSLRTEVGEKKKTTPKWCRRISQVTEVNVWVGLAPPTHANLWLKNYAFAVLARQKVFFSQHHFNRPINESEGKCGLSVLLLCEVTRHLSELRHSSCSSSVLRLPPHPYILVLSLKSVTLSSSLPSAHFHQIPGWLAGWLTGSLISSRTRRIGSGLEVWHCHNVGGDETALRLTLLDLTWLALSGRCTFHPPPIDRRENYSKGETICM